MAVDPNKMISRGATGAAIGSVVPGIGTLAGGAGGAIVGLLEGLFSGDGGQGAVDAAGAEKMRRMQEAYGVLMQQRGQRQQTQMNMLANRMGAYQGANNVLASMYGPMGSMAPNINTGSGGPTMRGASGPPPASQAPPSGPPGGMQNPSSIRSLTGQLPQLQGGAAPGGPPGGLQNPTGIGALAGQVGQAPIIRRPPSLGGGQAPPPALSPSIASIAQMMSGGARLGQSPLRRAV